MACLCGSPKVILDGQCKWCIKSNIRVENGALVPEGIDSLLLKQILFDTTYTNCCNDIKTTFCPHHRWNVCNDCIIQIITPPTTSQEPAVSSGI